MHWRTFERLQASHDSYINATPAVMTAKLGLTRERLDALDLL